MTLSVAFMCGVCVLFASGCGSAPAENPLEPENPVPADTSTLLTGTVIAADSFVVPATTTNFEVTLFPNGGSLPASLPASSGKILALSVVDQSRPGFVCMGGVFDTNCASIVVFEDQVSPNVSLGISSGRINLYLHDSFGMEPEPPPG